MKRKTYLLALVLCLTSITFAQTKKFHGVSFNTELKLDGENLVINGAGLREKYFMDLYVAGLYVPKKTEDAKKVIYDDTEMAIHIGHRRAGWPAWRQLPHLGAPDGRVPRLAARNPAPRRQLPGLPARRPSAQVPAQCSHADRCSDRDGGGFHRPRPVKPGPDTAYKLPDQPEFGLSFSATTERRTCS